MTAPPARPHVGFRPSSHFSIITAAQANTDWAEDDAWDSGSDDDKPLAPPRKHTPSANGPPTPSRNGTLNLLPNSGAIGTFSGPSPGSTAPTPPRPPSNTLSAPIPFKQPSGPTPLNMIRAASNNLRKPGPQAAEVVNPSIGSGTPNSTSSAAELSFSYTHVHAPSPSSYPPTTELNNVILHAEPETASIGEGATTTATTTDDDESRNSVEVSSPPGAKGRGWMFIKGHNNNNNNKGKGGPEAAEHEKEGYRRWEMSATGSVDFGGMMPDAPDSDDDDEGESDADAMMVVGDLDVDVDPDGSGRGREKEVGGRRGTLEFVRARASGGSEDEKGKGKRTSVVREVVEEEEEETVVKEKEGVEAIREDADAIVADPFSVLRRAHPYGHESGYNTKPQPSRQSTSTNTVSPSHVKSPERPTDSPSRRERISIVQDRPASTSSSSGTGGLSRGRSVRTNRRHSQFVECLSKEDINMAELKKLAWSGVPPHLRPIVWPLLLGYIPLPSSTRLQTLQRKREEFRNMVKLTFARGREGLDQQIWHQIKIDVPRTRPGVRLWMEPGTHQVRFTVNVNLRGGELIDGGGGGMIEFRKDIIRLGDPTSCERPTSVYADPENYDPSNLPEHILNAIEADSFWCLSRLLDGIQDNYISQQPGIHRSVKRMAELVKRIDAPLAAHLESQSVEFMQFAFRWMNCLLMREISVKNTIRMWDTYLAEGTDSFSQFHLYVCSAFLVKWSEKLKGMDFQGIIMFLQALPTQSWTDHEVELLLSEAFLLSSVWHNAQSHFG
ncbi:GTPase-activating protein [Ceratobasidium sp. 395]|nr:GTPase-activating protein [Ceratobasidium sp. 395]